VTVKDTWQVTTRSAPINIPPESVIVETRTVGPFVTRQTYRLADGADRTWSSRRHRKVGLIHEQRRSLDRPWWQPRLLGWWIAALFMLGSFLFALGALPWYADLVTSRVVGLTFFVGSLIFTTAGYLQYVETINAPDRPGTDGHTRQRTRFLAWQPRRIDWWVASVQSVGTVLFNVSTATAMIEQFTLRQQERLVWAPDMFGSVAFLVASALAWLEFCHGWWRWQPRDVSWRIVALNLGGSIAFQVSALAAFIRPATGELLSVPVANLGTFVGAIGFLLGAALLIPEMADR
jgi:YrhK-like protein